jgi:hypothetical protein
VDMPEPGGWKERLGQRDRGTEELRDRGCIRSPRAPACCCEPHALAHTRARTDTTLNKLGRWGSLGGEFCPQPRSCCEAGRGGYRVWPSWAGAGCAPVGRGGRVPWGGRSPGLSPRGRCAVLGVFVFCERGAGSSVVGLGGGPSVCPAGHRRIVSGGVCISRVWGICVSVRDRGRLKAGPGDPVDSGSGGEGWPPGGGGWLCEDTVRARLGCSGNLPRWERRVRVQSDRRRALELGAAGCPERVCGAPEDRPGCTRSLRGVEGEGLAPSPLPAQAQAS